MNKQEFKDLTGESPIDIFGGDWYLGQQVRVKKI